MSIFIITSKSCWLNANVLTGKKIVPFLEYCNERNENLISEAMYPIVLFSVTNKIVDVKEGFC